VEWVCQPRSRTVTDANGVGICAFCGAADATVAHAETYLKAAKCAKGSEAKHTWTRYDHFLQHVQRCHQVSFKGQDGRKTQQARQLQYAMKTQWVKAKPADSRALSCKICDDQLDTWEKRCRQVKKCLRKTVTTAVTEEKRNEPAY